MTAELTVVAQSEFLRELRDGSLRTLRLKAVALTRVNQKLLTAEDAKESDVVRGEIRTEPLPT
jgi:hypothetical protein